MIHLFKMLQSILADKSDYLEISCDYHNKNHELIVKKSKKVEEIQNL